MFELIDRDAGGRIGKWTIEKHSIQTPNICIVINPNKMPVSIADLKKEFKAEIIITNSYIINRSENLRKQAEEKGLHKMLGWDGPIYTDSGTFQMFSQGVTDINPKAIVAFEKSIGSDIITPVDLFTTPLIEKAEAKKNLLETVKRIKDARKVISDRNLVGPIQGGRFLDLRIKASKEVAKSGADVFAIGGIVPLMEQYRYKELIDIVATCKANLPADRPIHAFGAGHPMSFALLTAFGCDLFDSAMYSLAADRDAYLTVNGTHQLSGLSELPCSCPVCTKFTAKEIKELEKIERSQKLAYHNLYVTFSEMRTIRQAIRENWLWELVQQRVRAHPNLLEALSNGLKSHQKLLQKLDPVSKKSALMWSGEETALRPEVLRAQEWMKRAKSKNTFSKGPFPKIPAGLKWLYPFSQSVLPNSYEKEKAKPEEVLAATLSYQFGAKTPKGAKVEISKNTGRPKHAFLKGKLLGTFRPYDGFFLPTMEGAKLLKMKKIEVKDKDAAKFVSKGKQLFAKFATPKGEIFPGEEVSVTHKGKIIAVGRSLLNSEEMQQLKRGVAVEVRGHL